MGKRSRSGVVEYAEREDELHDPKGKTKRLTISTRTPRDTDNPQQDSVVGPSLRPHLHPVKSRPPKASVVVGATAQSIPSLPPPAPALVPESVGEKSAETESVAKEGTKTAKKKSKRKEKAARKEERKKSHTTGGNTQALNQKANDSLKPSASIGTKGVAKVPNEKVGGATITRLKPEDKEELVRQDRSLYIGLPRGQRSVVAVGSLSVAVFDRLRKRGIQVESTPTSSSKFLVAKFFDTEGRDRALAKLSGFTFSHEGNIITPEIAKYGVPELGKQVTTYQIPRAFTSSSDIVCALVDLLLADDKALPPFSVFELLNCEIPVRSLLVQFSAAPPSLGRKIVLLGRQVTQLSNSKCILCKKTDHTLWDCPSPPTQVSHGFSVGPKLFEFAAGDTWEPKLVEGLEDKQRNHTWSIQTRDSGPAVGSSSSEDESESDTNGLNAKDTPKVQPKKRVVVEKTVVIGESESEEKDSNQEGLDTDDGGDPVDETPF